MRHALLFAVAILLPMQAAAQSARVFVSGTGNDANLCTNTSPCRSFAHAITVVNSGGEIIPLDSAGYGTVVIDRSVSISAPQGIYAGVTATGAGTSGISVGADSLNIFLRGLTINGVGADYGVLSFAGSTVLRMERMNIQNFTYACVLFESGEGLLLMSDSTLANSRWGVFVTTTMNHIARATLDRLRGEGFTYASSLGSLVIAQDNSLVSVRDSIALGNFRGFEVYDHALLALENCVSTHNVVGLFGAIDPQNTGTPVMYVSNSVITYNSLYGIEPQLGAGIYSRSDNTVLGNGAKEIFNGFFSAK